MGGGDKVNCGAPGLREAQFVPALVWPDVRPSRPRRRFRQHRVTKPTGGTGWEVGRVRNGGEKPPARAPARAPRRRPALARPGGGALAPPQPDAHLPRQGAGVEPGRSPRSGPGPSPRPTARQLFTRPNWEVGRGGVVSPITPAPARPRSWSAAERAGFPGAGAPRGGGLGVCGWGGGGTRIAEPPLVCAPSPPSSGTPPPSPRGRGRRRRLRTAPRGGPCAVPPPPVPARPPPPASRGVPPHPTSCERTRSLPLTAEFNINHRFPEASPASHASAGQGGRGDKRREGKLGDFAVGAELGGGGAARGARRRLRRAGPRAGPEEGGGGGRRQTSGDRTICWSFVLSFKVRLPLK